ncbi:MAG: hypothetical protein RMK29_01785 [Myxococcales bacterium]|nr:hypothetical protein [Myxococcota bacterium]MDW8280411.1 hypothetical protein [Myxococcales bacterium]
MRTGWLPWLSCLVGCSNLLPGPYTEPAPPDLAVAADMVVTNRPTRLILEPAEPQRLRVEGGRPATFTWRAHLRYEDTGELREVTDTSAWSVVARPGQRTLLGVVDRGRFQSGPRSAGAGKVRVEYMGQRAEVDLALELHAVRLSTDDDGSAPPMDAPQRFGGPLTATKAPTLLYPPSGAVLPQNLGRMVVQWLAQGGTDLFEVRLRAELLDLRIYTTSPRRLTLSDEDMTLLTDAGLFGPVTLEVRGGNRTGDGSHGTSLPASLRAATAIIGATYYFATPRPGGAQGIWRHSWVAGTGTATPYLTEQSGITGRRCVGCHALSRDGGFLSVSHNQDQLASGSLLNVRLGTAHFVAPQLRWMFSSLSGTGEEAIVAGGGVFTLIKTDMGSGGEPVPVGPTTPTLAVMPVLSPDGQRIVYVRGQQLAGQSEAHIVRGNLHVIERQGGSFGAPRDLVLVPATGFENNYYPALSPDSQWVLFNRVSPTSLAASDSYDNVAAALFAVPLDRSLPPIRLNQANDTFATQNPNVRANASNSYPAFLPSPCMLDGRPVYFFTFASRRDHGVEVTRNGTGPRAAGATTRVLGPTAAQDVTLNGWNQQIWLSLFDPARAAQGLDPSTPALWLPFQSPLSSNHMAVSVQALLGDSLN